MLDIHSHITPGVDDGAKKLSETLEMIRNSIKEGTNNIVATPHFRKGYYEVNYKEIKEIVKSLNKLLSEEGLNVNIYCGQEIYYTDEIIKLYKSGVIGTINNSRYMLIELSMGTIDKQSVLETIYELNLLDLKPIIAHPERCKGISEDKEFLNNLIDEGCLFQLNSGSIKGDFGKNIKKIAIGYIKSNLYSFIGSDAHNNKNRKTGLKESLDYLNRIDRNYYKRLQSNSIKLIRDEEIDFEGEYLIEKKKFIFF
ncbi:MAG: tyrosine-protein phosphatase [Clostridium sp.]